MSITSITSKSDTIFSPLGDNNIIKLLERQKQQLQEQIQKVNESKLDDETKQERIEQLQNQIQQIDMEIQRKRSEKLNQNQNSNKEAASKQSNTGSNEDSSNSTGMSRLVQASATYSQAKIMNNVKNNLNNKSNILKIEIELDGSRGGNAKAKRAELQEIEQREQMLDKKVGETLQASQKQAKEASKEESKNDGINNIGEDRETNDTQKAMENNNADIHNAASINNDEEGNFQPQGIKGIDKNYKKLDIRV